MEIAEHALYDKDANEVIYYINYRKNGENYFWFINFYIHF